MIISVVGHFFQVTKHKNSYFPLQWKSKNHKEIVESVFFRVARCVTRDFYFLDGFSLGCQFNAKIRLFNYT